MSFSFSVNSKKAPVKLKAPFRACLQAVATVLPITFMMILVTSSGLFSKITVELGLQHYAEKRPFWLNWLPDFLLMPLNTAINLGYIICGLYWVFFIAQANRMGFIKCQEAYLFYVFNTMSSVYGCIQGYRIVQQTRNSAIMDQWYTLPFFMMVFIWAKSFTSGWSTKLSASLMLASITSFGAALLSSIGFEIALGCHIVLAVIGAVLSYRKYPSEDCLYNFVMAVLSCSGFVILKVLDLYLPKVHWVFYYLSGHFLSKICDILQVHYVNEFFFAMTFNKGATIDVKLKSG